MAALSFCSQLSNLTSWFENPLIGLILCYELSISYIIIYLKSSHFNLFRTLYAHDHFRLSKRTPSAAIRSRRGVLTSRWSLQPSTFLGAAESGGTDVGQDTILSQEKNHLLIGLLPILVSIGNLDFIIGPVVVQPFCHFLPFTEKLYPSFYPA